jgi:hypothetical protein
MAKSKISERWRRTASDAALVGVYAGVVLALFGSFAFEHVARSTGIQIALVSTAMAVLVASGIWLDRREARREGAVSED